MKAYMIGRSPKVDIVVSHSTVSRRHAELLFTENGRYYLNDCGSKNGTRVRQHGRWTRIKQTFVTRDQPLRLGEYETTARRLIASMSNVAIRARADTKSKSKSKVTDTEVYEIELKPSAKSDLPRGKVERNPETGEVIPRRS